MAPLLVLLLLAAPAPGCTETSPVASLVTTIQAAAAIPPYEAQALLAAHRSAPTLVSAARQRFEGVDGRDVYNPTAPFQVGGKTVVAARVESRESEIDSTVVFFQQKTGSPDTWVPVKGAATLPLQDPFVTTIDGEAIVGGVQVFPLPGGRFDFFTVFYATRDLKSFRAIARGPDRMKDIRLVQLADQRIGVFTRPQNELALALGAPGPKGSAIGFTTIDRLSDLSAQVIEKAPLLPARLPATQWGGPNEAHLLPDGTVKVLGHVARKDDAGNLHYYPITFRLDPVTRQQSDFRLLLERGELGPGASKRPDLTDVLFSGGIVPGPGATQELWVGAGDAEVWKAVIR